MSENVFLLEMGNRVSLKRKEKNLTQEQLAEIIGVSLQTISNIECGKKGARPENIVKICHALSCSADYILLGEKSESQLKGISRAISSLNEEKYQAVEKIVCLLQSE